MQHSYTVLVWVLEAGEQLPHSLHHMLMTSSCFLFLGMAYRSCLTLLRKLPLQLTCVLTQIRQCVWSTILMWRARLYVHLFPSRVWLTEIYHLSLSLNIWAISSRIHFVTIMTLIEKSSPYLLERMFLSDAFYIAQDKLNWGCMFLLLRCCTVGILS